MRFNKLIPELSVSDFDKSVHFYTKVLGFKIEYSRDDFVFLSFQGSQLMIEKKNSNWSTGRLVHPYGRGVNFQIEVKDVRSILRLLKKHKYPIKVPLKTNWYKVGKKLLGNKEFLVMDPDGYLLRFSEDVGVK